MQIKLNSILKEVSKIGEIYTKRNNVTIVGKTLASMNT